MRASAVLIFCLSVLYACVGNTKLQYMPDMADAPTVKTQEDYLDPPLGSVSREAILYASSAEVSTAQPTVVPDLAQGQKLYATFCAVCHGERGDGNVPIVDDGFPRPPDLTQALYRERAYGFFFHRVSLGTVLMPSYGHAMSVAERWQVVHYVRTFHGGAKKDVKR